MYIQYPEKHAASQYVSYSYSPNTVDVCTMHKIEYTWHTTIAHIDMTILYSKWTFSCCGRLSLSSSPTCTQQLKERDRMVVTASHIA